MTACGERIAATLAAPPADEVVVEVPAELELETDPQALEHVIANLLANAVRHGAPPVKLSAGQLDRHLRISVEDHGAGVPPEFVPQLFERFTHADASDKQGAGLGLAIARSYAAALGGELLYQRLHPSGTRFQLVLPRHPDHTTHKRPAL